MILLLGLRVFIEACPPLGGAAHHGAHTVAVFFGQQTAQFAEAFSKNDRFALALVLCSMEKMPRDQLHRCLSQWKMSLTDAIAYRSGMPCAPDAQLLGQHRTAQDLAMAAEKIQEAMEYCNANIGAGHICGTLAASL